MTIKEGTAQIRALLDALAKKKTDRDRLFVLFKMKVVVEAVEEPLKKRTDQRQAAYDAETRIIKKALKQLLTALDRISAKHEELGDSHVRDQIYATIYRNFIRPDRKGRALPESFGMFSDGGNDMIRVALEKFLAHPEIVAASKKLKTAEERFAAFQDNDVRTAEDTTCFEYFGYSKQVRVP